MLSQTASPTTHIIERSSDTGVLVLILKYAQHIDPIVLFDTGTGNKRRLLNVKQIVEIKWFELRLALTALHCLTGGDKIRAFLRKGKITLLKVLEKFLEFIDFFGGLEEHVTCSASY